MATRYVWYTYSPVENKPTAFVLDSELNSYSYVYTNFSNGYAYTKDIPNNFQSSKLATVGDDGKSGWNYICDNGSNNSTTNMIAGYGYGVRSWGQSGTSGVTIISGSNNYKRFQRFFVPDTTSASGPYYGKFYKLNVLDVSSSAGSRIGTVSSSSSTAYPNDGESNGTYYEKQGSDNIDPRSISYPTSNITASSSVTVSLATSSSNVYGGTISYTYQYSTNGGSSWYTIKTTTASSISYTIPSNATQIRFRAYAKDNYGFTSSTYVTGSNVTLSSSGGGDDPSPSGNSKGYVGVNGVARKIKTIYVGVNGVARKVKKAYIGVNGVARLFYSQMEIAQVPYQYITAAPFYNGKEQSTSFVNYDPSKMTIGGTTSAVNAGAYTAIFTLKTGYCWPDGSTSPKNVNWQIRKADPTVYVLQTGGVNFKVGYTKTISGEYYGNGSVTSVTSDSPNILQVSSWDQGTKYSNHSVVSIVFSGRSVGAANINISIGESDNYKAGTTTFNLKVEN